MRAALMQAHGGPEQLHVTEVETPAPGPGDVLVRVTASAVNNTDIWTREGRYGTAADPDAVAGWLGAPIDCPRIQGADIAGVIEAVGTGVDAAVIGRRVVVDPAIYDDGAHDPDHADIVGVVGSEIDGGFADFAVIDAGSCHDVTPAPATT